MGLKSMATMKAKVTKGSFVDEQQVKTEMNNLI